MTTNVLSWVKKSAFEEALFLTDASNKTIAVLGIVALSFASTKYEAGFIVAGFALILGLMGLNVFMQRRATLKSWYAILNSQADAPAQRIQRVLNYWAQFKDAPALYLSHEIGSCVVRNKIWAKTVVFVKISQIFQEDYLWKFVLDHEYMHTQQMFNKWSLSSEKAKTVRLEVLQIYTEKSQNFLFKEIDADAFAVSRSNKIKTLNDFIFTLKKVFEKEFDGNKDESASWLKGEGTFCRVRGLLKTGLLID